MRPVRSGSARPAAAPERDVQCRRDAGPSQRASAAAAKAVRAQAKWPSSATNAASAERHPFLASVGHPSGPEDSRPKQWHSRRRPRARLASTTALNPASVHIPVTRANGITEVIAAPGIGGFDLQSSGIIAGQASAFNLAGWTMEEMQISRSVAMVLNWPSIQTSSFDFSTFRIKEKPYADAKKEYDKSINQLSDWFTRARHYAQAKEKGSPGLFVRDLKLESLVPVVQGKLPLLVVADDARDIRNAVDFCTKQNLKMILASGAESWKVKDLLKEKKIAVILGPTERLPEQEDTPYDKPMTQPAELNAAGIPFAFSSFGTSFSRRLPQYAGTAVGYGLSHDQALKAVMLNAAQIFGLADQLGTIEQGKLANLIVTTGDPLEMQTEVRYLFIKGQLSSTDNKHKELYEQFRKRPAPAR